MYQALYRRYRPTKFAEAVGQGPILQTLEHSLNTSKVGHAYLFSGPRGTGKTTFAKILAKAVNCLDLQDGDACNVCSNCREADSKECVDIIEIDAASNNGVDEIRELKNKINLVPAKLKYKVYIIDEVHMLSIGAFNALLKTLEEPPQHVIFILATTDPQKVPITIVSRCQCFSFKRFSIEDLVGRLEEVAKKENINIEEDVLIEIAKYADGGLRDALGLLDKLSSYASDKITIEDFQTINGLLTNADVSLFIGDVFAVNYQSVLQKIDVFYQAGKDFVQLAKQLTDVLRNYLVAHYVNEEQLDYDPDQMLSLINTLNKVSFEMHATANVKILLEMCLIGFMNQLSVPERDKIISREIIDVKEKPQQPFQKVSSVVFEEENVSLGETIEKVDEAPVNDLKNKLIDIRLNNTFAKADKKVLETIKGEWTKLAEYTFDSKIGYLVCMLLDGTLRVACCENLIISYEYESLVEKSLENTMQLENILCDILGFKQHLVFISDDRWNKEREIFIERKKKGEAYIYLEEPVVDMASTIEENKTRSVAVETAVNLFGDLVEIE